MDITKEMQAAFLQRRQKDIEECWNSLAHTEFQAFERIGHQLKGNAVSFGFPELSTLGIEMETAALAKDAVKLLQLTKNFVSIVEVLQARHCS